MKGLTKEQLEDLDDWVNEIEIDKQVKAYEERKKDERLAQINGDILEKLNERKKKMIDITELSEQDLQKKIKNIKAEREKTENALKKYEEELERRKQEVSLGVPLGTGQIFGNIQESFKKTYTTITLKEVFRSTKSSDLFFQRLETWRQEYTANAKGKPIDIQVLLPLLRKGWVAMARNKRWYWYSSKPNIDLFLEMWKGGPETYHIGGFDLKPAENWETSLMECGL